MLNVFNELQKQASALSGFINETENIIHSSELLERLVQEHGEEHAHKIMNVLKNPKPVIGALLGTAALTAAVQPAINLHSNKLGLQKTDVPQVAKDHPYLSSTAVGVPANMATLALGAVPLAPNIVQGAKSGIDAAIAAELHKNKEKGVMLDLVRSHPVAGAAVSSMVPIINNINPHVAGEVMAENSLKDKGFISKHPYLATYLSTLAPVPGFHKAVNHAAARVLLENEG